jgi:hypothetical protein
LSSWHALEERWKNPCLLGMHSINRYPLSRSPAPSSSFILFLEDAIESEQMPHLLLFGE